MNYYPLFAILSAGIAITPANAQSVAQLCLPVYEEAVRNVEHVHNEDASNFTVYSLYCSQNGEAKEFTSDASFSFPIKGIPISASGTGNFSQAELSNFCKEGFEQGYSDSSRFSFISRVSVDALDNFNECIRIGQDDLIITHSETGLGSLVIRGDIISNNSRTRIDTIAVDPAHVQCFSPNFGDPNTPLDGNEVLDPMQDDFAIRCTRPSVFTADGEYYPPASVTLSTSQGLYTVNWRANTLRGLFLANQADALILDAISDRDAAREQAESAAAKAAAAERLYDGVTIRNLYYGNNPVATFLRDEWVNCGHGITPPDRIIASACAGDQRMREYSLIYQSGGNGCGHKLYAVMCVPQ